MATAWPEGNIPGSACRSSRSTSLTSNCSVCSTDEEHAATTVKEKSVLDRLISK